MMKLGHPHSPSDTSRQSTLDTIGVEALKEGLKLEIREAKTDANSAYKRGLLDDAALQYTLAIQKLGQLRALTKEHQPTVPDEGSQVTTPVTVLLAEGGYHDAEFAQLHYRRAGALLRLGRHREAVQDLDAALTINPEMAKCYLAKGEALVVLGQYAAASECLLQGLTKVPYDPALMERFKATLTNLRHQWHQYCPALRGKMGSTSPAQEFDFGAAAVTLPALPSAEKIDPAQGVRDGSVQEELRKAHGFLNLDDIFEEETAFWHQHNIYFDKQVFWEGLSEVLVDFKNVLRSLFTAYCRINPTVDNPGIPAKKGAQPTARKRPGRVLRQVNRSNSQDTDGSQKALTILTPSTPPPEPELSTTPDSRPRALSFHSGTIPNFSPLSIKCSITARQLLDLVEDCTFLKAAFGWGQVVRVFSKMFTAASKNQIPAADIRPLGGQERSRIPSYGDLLLKVGDESRPMDISNVTTNGLGYEKIDNQEMQNSKSSVESPIDDASIVSSISTLDKPELEGFDEELYKKMGKESAATKLSEVFGSQQRLLFPQFIEALIRIALARYGPTVPDDAPSARRRSTVGMNNSTSNQTANSQHSKMSSNSAKKRMIHSLSALYEGGSTPVAILSDRLRFAFETHLLQNHHCSNSASQIDLPVPPNIQDYRVRLKKVFLHFSNGSKIGDTPMLDIRQFIFMFKALGLCGGGSLSLRDICTTSIASISFLGIAEADLLSFDDFVKTMFYCIDIKTFDGLCSAEQRLENFLSNVFFPKIKLKTSIAVSW